MRKREKKKRRSVEVCKSRGSALAHTAPEREKKQQPETENEQTERQTNKQTNKTKAEEEADKRRKEGERGGREREVHGKINKS